MGKARLKQTTIICKEILESMPHTRNSDHLLYEEYCKRVEPSILSVSFKNVLHLIDHLGISNIESVGRCRRKLQAKYPHLRANANVEAGRMLNEERFREYAKANI